MMTFTIHSEPRPATSQAKWPHQKLKPGEWFLVPCPHKRRRKTQQTLCAAGRRWSRLGKGRFRTVLVHEGCIVERIE